jgi:hypothetical protein
MCNVGDDIVMGSDRKIDVEQFGDVSKIKYNIE